MSGQSTMRQCAIGNHPAAWLVVEKMEGTIGDNDVNLQTVVRGWRCTISSRGKEYSSSAETAPLAICRAALLAELEMAT